jgi:hypothetical protein
VAPQGVDVFLELYCGVLIIEINALEQQPFDDTEVSENVSWLPEHIVIDLLINWSDLFLLYNSINDILSHNVRFFASVVTVVGDVSSIADKTCNFVKEHVQLFNAYHFVDDLIHLSQPAAALSGVGGVKYSVKEAWGWSDRANPKLREKFSHLLCAV